MSLLFNMLSRLVIGCCLGSLGKEVATHTNILAWKMPWTEEPCRLQFMGSQRVREERGGVIRFGYRLDMGIKGGE